MMVTKTSFQNQKGGVVLFLVIAVILLGVLITGGFSAMPKPQVAPTPTPIPPKGVPDLNAANASSGTQSNLQLKTIPFTTPAPPTGSSCGVDNNTVVANSGQTTNLICQCSAWFLTCTNGSVSACTDSPNARGKCSDFYAQEQQMESTFQRQFGVGVRRRLCQVNGSHGDGIYCIDKPVIYLYPEKPTFVDVQLTIPGTIYISIPSYPVEGWKHVLANPNGSLMYQDKNYGELYYESAIKHITAPQNGIVIPTSQLREKLLLYTAKLGLKQTEQEEFLSYWMPKLEDLNKPYILFSVLDQSEKERIDHVDINPKPDTFIAFLVYFKPLDIPVAIAPLNLPKTPPQRVGFTAVEWGGTIDK